MIQEIEQALPEHWRGFFRLASAPIAWLMPFQEMLIDASSRSYVEFFACMKRFFLLPPALAVAAGLWCTMLAIYTLPFRSYRIRFIGTIAVLWWDVARSSWLFWSGMLKFLWVAFGSFWGMLRMVVSVTMEMVRELFELPFVMTGTITKNLREPGVPWIAFLMTVAWAAIEGVVFTYVLSPTMSEILSDIRGTENHPLLGAFLFMMLFAMVAGSLACMHVLVESIAKRDYKQVVQMLVVEFCVMAVEVVFLYRELVDALTPWIAQQTGMQMGIVPVLMIASLSWLGIRGMVWFLFARFGTPMLLALISRQRLPEEAAEVRAEAAERSEERWEKVIGKIKREQEWFQAQGQALLEALILPPFQLVAASLNFFTALFLSQPIFSLPFKSLAEVGETKALLRSVFSLGDHP